MSFSTIWEIPWTDGNRWESYRPVQLQEGCNSSSPGDPKLLGFVVFPMENGNDTVDESFGMFFFLVENWLMDVDGSEILLNN